MGLPGDLTTIIVTGSYPNISGQPQSGSVKFDPGQAVADSTGKVILTGLVTRQVFNGVMQPVTLPCTDNSGLNPTGFAFTVTETFNGVVRSYQVQLPHTLGSTVDLSSLTPVTDPVPSNTFTGDNTWTGNQEFDGGIKIPADASDGDVLTADAEGNATWQAPTGGSGGGSDANFTHSFTALSTVTVTHNLGKLPAVTVIDSAEDVVVGDIHYVDDNSLTVSFSAPFTGIVICN